MTPKQEGLLIELLCRMADAAEQTSDALDSIARDVETLARQGHENQQTGVTLCRRSK